MLARVDVLLHAQVQHLARQRVYASNPLNLVAEKLHAHRNLLVCRHYLKNIASHPEPAAPQVVVIAVVVHRNQPPHDPLHPRLVADAQTQRNLAVLLRRTQSVDTGHASHDQHIPPSHQRARRSMAQSVNLFVNISLFFDIRVRSWDVSLRLVVVVVGDEVLYGIVGEILLELRCQLSRQSLVMRDYQRRTLHLLDDVRYRVSLARTRHSQQRLMLQSQFTSAFHQLIDRMRLVALRLKLMLNRKVANRNFCYR